MYTTAEEIIEIEELDETELDLVCGGEALSPADYLKLGDALGQVVIKIATKFIPVMPSVKALNVQSLLQERIEDYINNNMEDYNVLTTALKLMDVDVEGFDKALVKEVRKRIKK